MANEQRSKVWVDQFQTKLTLRICAYLGLFLIVLTNFLFGWRLWAEGPGNPAEQFVRMLRDYLPVWISLAALVVVVGWDAIRFTHRLVGPLVRFRQVFKDLARGEPVRPIKLRDGDYLTDLRDDVNEMLAAFQRRGIDVLKPADPAAEGAKQQRASA
jgi:hypothetical protein